MRRIIGFYNKNSSGDFYKPSFQLFLTEIMPFYKGILYVFPFFMLVNRTQRCLGKCLLVRFILIYIKSIELHFRSLCLISMVYLIILETVLCLIV